MPVFIKQVPQRDCRLCRSETLPQRAGLLGVLIWNCVPHPLGGGTNSVKKELLHDNSWGALAKEIFRRVKSKPKHHGTMLSRKYLYIINEGGIDLSTALTDADDDVHTKYPDISTEKYEAPKLVALADDEAVAHECEQILNQNSTFNLGPSLQPLCLTLSNTSESADIVLKVYAPVSFLFEGSANFGLGSGGHDQAFRIVESVIVVILMTTFEYHGTTYAHGIDASLLTVSFIVFQIGLCLMIILITWVFPKGGATWSILTRRALGKDSITILEIWGCMLFSDAVMAFLACSFRKFSLEHQ
ncbi:hypothetical protein HPB50_028424 [Hyalomma asiaticum]|nr:hypothetical protein HPB50_028424 [Hyalomma asiaticum]